MEDILQKQYSTQNTTIHTKKNIDTENSYHNLFFLDIPFFRYTYYVHVCTIVYEKMTMVIWLVVLAGRGPQ